MLKPLELTIYPKPEHAHVTGGWLWDCEACNTVITGPSKRLTNAELAAEAWRSDADAAAHCHADSTETTWPEDYEKQAETLLRFATLPHALDEEVTP